MLKSEAPKQQAELKVGMLLTFSPNPQLDMLLLLRLSQWDQFGDFREVDFSVNSSFYYWWRRSCVYI